MKKPSLTLNNISVTLEQKPLLTNLSMAIQPGSVTVIMGPNGSGKSTLALTIMGHPRYTITGGTIEFQEKILNDMSATERAHLGLFLSMQNPLEIEGVSFKQFMRQAMATVQEKRGQQATLQDFTNRFSHALTLVGLDQSFGQRALNVGFSGGEKKKAELAQLALLQPKLAILDEIDSGLDVDALRTVCAGIEAVRKENPGMAIIIITHYTRMLQHLATPDTVHVLSHGTLVRSGGIEVAHDIELHGYGKN